MGFVLNVSLSNETVDNYHFSQPDLMFQRMVCYFLFFFTYTNSHYLTIHYMDFVDCVIKRDVKLTERKFIYVRDKVSHSISMYVLN